MWAIKQKDKPKKQRRPCPNPPPGFMALINKDKITREDIANMNNLAFTNYNEVALIPCHFCNRTFSNDAYEVHKKICSVDRPFKPLKKEKKQEPLSYTTNLQEARKYKKVAKNTVKPSSKLDKTGTLTDYLNEDDFQTEPKPMPKPQQRTYNNQPQAKNLKMTSNYQFNFTFDGKRSKSSNKIYQGSKESYTEVTRQNEYKQPVQKQRPKPSKPVKPSMPINKNNTRKPIKKMRESDNKYESISKAQHTQQTFESISNMLDDSVPLKPTSKSSSKRKTFGAKKKSTTVTSFEDPMGMGQTGMTNYNNHATNHFLEPCRKCGRTFNEDRLAKHENACTAGKKVKVKRFHKKYKPPKKKKAEGVPKWKREHEQFQANIAYMKKMKKAEEAGIDIRTIEAPKQTYVDNSLKACPHCARKFNETAHERHVKICKNVFNKPKPPPLKKNQALAKKYGRGIKRKK